MVGLQDGESFDASLIRGEAEGEDWGYCEE